MIVMVPVEVVITKVTLVPGFHHKDYGETTCNIFAFYVNEKVIMPPLFDQMVNNLRH